jgi:hypothetical protein
MPTLRGVSSEWLAQFDGMPDELRQFAMEKQPATPHAIDQSVLPPGTRLRPSEATNRPSDPMSSMRILRNFAASIPGAFITPQYNLMYFIVVKVKRP